VAHDERVARLEEENAKLREQLAERDERITKLEARLAGRPRRKPASSSQVLARVSCVASLSGPGAKTDPWTTPGCRSDRPKPSPQRKTPRQNDGTCGPNRSAERHFGCVSFAVSEWHSSLHHWGLLFGGGSDSTPSFGHELLMAVDLTLTERSGLARMPASETLGLLSVGRRRSLAKAHGCHSYRQ